MTKECQQCNGTGWIIEVKNDRQFAMKCSCQDQDIRVNKSIRANIPHRFIGARLDEYFPEEAQPSQKAAQKAIKKFISDYPATPKGILLQGRTGVGKTRLLCSIATELMIKIPNIDLYYIDWNDLVREMRSGEDTSSRDFASINQLIQKLINVDLLLFDEIGASMASPWVYDNLYYLINKRYNDNKITILATNFFDDNSDMSLEKRVGIRIRSRLYEMTKVLKIEGCDFREKYP